MGVEAGGLGALDRYRLQTITNHRLREGVDCHSRNSLVLLTKHLISYQTTSRVMSSSDIITVHAMAAHVKGVRCLITTLTRDAPQPWCAHMIVCTQWTRVRDRWSAPQHSHSSQPSIILPMQSHTHTPGSSPRQPSLVPRLRAPSRPMRACHLTDDACPHCGIRFMAVALGGGGGVCCQHPAALV